MRERSIRAVSKTVKPSGFGGSNPPLSVIYQCQSRTSIFLARNFGKMSEWFKVHAWKACVPKRYRGFESPSFRLSSGAMQIFAAKPRQSRKAATVCGRKSCRRLPELFYLLYYPLNINRFCARGQASQFYMHFTLLEGDCYV